MVTGSDLSVYNFFGNTIVEILSWFLMTGALSFIPCHDLDRDISFHITFRSSKRNENCSTFADKVLRLGFIGWIIYKIYFTMNGLVYLKNVVTL